MSRVRLTTPARVLLVALTVLTPMGLGGVLDWVAPVALGIATLALGLGMFHHGVARVPLIACLPLAALALCLLQVTPLPPPLLHLLSPGAESLREFALLPLGLERWRPISIDAGATWAEATKSLLYFVTIVGAYHAARSRTGVPLLIGTVAALGPLFVVIGGLHALFGLDQLFGFYTFKESAPPLLTPFGDANHLAGLLTLSACACVGLVVESADRSTRVLWAGIWVVACAGVLWSGSRAGISVFLLTQFFLVGYVAWVLRGRDEARVRGRALTLATTVLVAIAAGAFTLGDRIWARFAQGSSIWMRSLVWPHVLEMIRDNPGVGVGRGTFAIAFSRYSTDLARVTYTHPENIVLQWTSELGVLFGPALLIFAATLLLMLLRQSRMQLLTFSALVGVVGVAVHNLADFSLEHPGVTVPCCVVLGVSAAAVTTKELKLRSAVLLGVVVCLGAMALVLTGAGFRSAENDLSRLIAVARHAPEVTAAARARIDLHPADHVLYTYAAVAEANLPGGSPNNALAYANRALYLAPVNPSAHRAAARALAKLGKRSQALLEYHLSASQQLDDDLVAEATSYATSTAELRLLGGAEPKVLAAVAHATRDRGVGALLLAEAAALKDAPPELTLEAVALWVAQGQPDAAAKLLDEAFEREGPSPDLYLARAKLLQARHDAAGAEQALDEALTKWPGQFELTLERVRLALSQNQQLAAAKLLQSASAVAVRPDQRLELSMVEAEVDIGLGRLNRAIELYQGAVLRSPSTRTHQALASAYAQASRYDDAIAELHAAEHFEGKEGQKALDDSIRSLEVTRDSKRAPKP